MKIEEIFKQNENKWIDFATFIVYSIGEVQPAEHGHVQEIVISDEIGKTATMAYYFTELELVFEKEYEGTECAFKLRYKGDRIQGYPVEVDEPKKIETAYQAYWNAVNFGKCRHGILVACIKSISDAQKIEKDVELQKTISNLAHFSMTGQVNEQ